ncbi:ankyrin repeat domain-containing protein [Streptomyces sp. NPDC020412]|uniref:ankyrin repeat domain-containing protein n=1 Tax=Streptomyces sp. NPDC020412 TaxID=3365073 RepID=UPI0037A307DF
MREGESVGVGPDALFEAVHGGDADAVVRALRSGVPADATDDEGQTALYVAALHNDLGVVRLLLAAGADPERPSGDDGGDLPLCGAAVGGHAQVVRALLSAGARPDTAESMGFRALTWAVQQGYATTTRVLLEAGADPELPGPGGEPPLVVAARRGSPRTVRALLDHGATAHRATLSAALAEARPWLERDVAQEVRTSLLDTWEDVTGTVTRRVSEEGGVTVVVEVLRDGRTVGGRESQTGHAAVVTLLESALGIRTPYAQLADRALRCGHRAQDNWTEQVSALWARGDEETFQAAQAWCASTDPLRRAFGADVLARLDGPDGALSGRAVQVLRVVTREATAPVLIEAAVAALGVRADASSLPDVLRHAPHPSPAVRRQVARSLASLVTDADGEGIAALVGLSADPNAGVRDRATASLAKSPADTPEIREALAARLGDPDPATAAEAAGGLARRQDPRAVPALVRLLADGTPDGPAYETALAAVDAITDETTRRRLESTVPRCR